MEIKTAVLIGASGLIGSHILSSLLEDDAYSEVRILTRRDLKLTHPKLKQSVINFDDQSEYRAALLGCNQIFCAIGTTNKKVKGNKKAYRKVDYDIPVQAAQFGFDLGVTHFSLVSSIGANTKSNNFYLQLKGEVEEEISQFSIPEIAIFRPSMLLGERTEFRFGERVSQKIMAPLSFLFPDNYKPIHALQVAKAMVNNTKNPNKGIQIFYYNQMVQLQS